MPILHITLATLSYIRTMDRSDWIVGHRSWYTKVQPPTMHKSYIVFIRKRQYIYCPISHFS